MSGRKSKGQGPSVTISTMSLKGKQNALRQERGRRFVCGEVREERKVTHAGPFVVTGSGRSLGFMPDF